MGSLLIKPLFVVDVTPMLTVAFSANFKADMGLETPETTQAWIDCPETGVSLFVYSTSLSVFETTQLSITIVLNMDGSLSSD